MTLLDQAGNIGKSFEIVAFEGDQVFRERLHEMGLRVGTRVSILGRAPFGGPVLIRFNQSFLALRNQEAQCAKVKAS